MTEPGAEGGGGDGHRMDNVLDTVSRHSRAITAIAALLVPVVVAVVGWRVNDSVSQRTVDAEYLNVAIGILAKPKGKDEPEEQRALRRYAVDLLTESSPVVIDEALRTSLIDGETNFPAGTTIPPLSLGSLGNSDLLAEQRKVARQRRSREATALQDAAATEVSAPEGCTVEITPRPSSPSLPRSFATFPVSAFASGELVFRGTYGVRAFRTPDDPTGGGDLRVAQVIRADEPPAEGPWVVLLDDYELRGC